MTLMELLGVLRSSHAVVWDDNSVRVAEGDVLNMRTFAPYMSREVLGVFPTNGYDSKEGTYVVEVLLREERG